MSTTYYCYREKYFGPGSEARVEKDEIFLANWIAKQVSCSLCSLTSLAIQQLEFRPCIVEMMEC